MSTKSFFDIKKNYLLSIGFVGLIVIVDKKIEYSNVSIKEDELFILVNYPGILYYTIDNIKYHYKSNMGNHSKYRYITLHAEIPGTETGFLLKRVSYNDKKELRVVGIYSDLISIQDSNDQLDSFMQQIIQKNIL